MSKLLHSHRYLGMHLENHCGEKVEDLSIAGVHLIMLHKVPEESGHLAIYCGTIAQMQILQVCPSQTFVHKLPLAVGTKVCMKGAFGESVSRESSTLVHWRGSSCSIRSPGIPDP